MMKISQFEPPFNSLEPSFKPSFDFFNELEKSAIDRIRNTDPNKFVQWIADIFEGDSKQHYWLGQALLPLRQDIVSRSDLIQAVKNALLQSTREQAVCMLNSFPSLVGKQFQSNSMSADSVADHKSQGLDNLTFEEQELFKKNNELYTTKFGFPFVICVRENKKTAILAGYADRLHNDVKKELMISLGQVSRIAAIRLNTALDNIIESLSSVFTSSRL